MFSRRNPLRLALERMLVCQRRSKISRDGVSWHPKMPQ
jgi:hypothetical protein